MSAPIPERRSSTPANAPPDLATRVVGAVWLAVFGVFGFILVRRVFGHDFGTTNTRVLSVIRLASVVLTAYPALLGLTALITGRRPPARFNPLGAPLQGWWYQGLSALTWRELKQVFFHPVAYIVLFVYLFINGILLAMLVSYFARGQSQDGTFTVAYFLNNNFYLWISLVLICPALTMRLISEERRTKSLELLLTAPVTETQVVLSKFAAVWGYFLFMTSFTLLYAAWISTYAPEAGWDWGPVLAGHFGLALIGALCTGIGVFTSAITRSQILAYLVAAVALLCLLVILQQVLQVPGLPPWLKTPFDYVTIPTHQDQFASGILSWRSTTFYLTSTALFLFFAVRSVAAQGGR